MTSWFFAILVGLAGFPTGESLAQAEGLPSVSISIPSTVPSETVQISYHLVGPFGGYGGYATRRAGVDSYEISAAVDGKAATEIRMIIYAPGCEIQTFVIPLAQDSKVAEEFSCQPVGTVRLSGKIVPEELVKGNNAELVVTYMAYWAHGFYGIADGLVAEFPLATVSPNEDGTFEIDLPYFSADAQSSSQPRASFRLMLRDAKTWNHIASVLEPEKQDLRLEEHGLRIRSEYPDDVIFTPAEPLMQLKAIKGKVFRSDSGEVISGSYILLTSEKGEQHFDARSDENGEYLFGGVPAGNYTVSVYAW